MKDVLRQANVSMTDFDSIIDIPIYGDSKLKNNEYSEFVQNQSSDAILDEYLNIKENLLDFGFCDSETEKFLSKYFNKIAHQDIRTKLLIFENFKDLDHLLINYNNINYSADLIYATYCFRRELYERGYYNYSVSSIINRARDFGYTGQELMQKYPLTEEKIQLLERIHKAKKKAIKQNNKIK